MINYFSTATVLAPSPISPDWIREGNPVARSRVLSRTADELGCTIIWDCTAGKFDWFYDINETILVLEGSVTIDDGVAPPKRLWPGDVAFFPAGSKAHWHVDEYVRKIAYCHRPLPTLMQTPVRLLRRLKARLRGQAAAGGLMNFDPGHS
ncbi:MAG: DUF861 domain-containing protein [Hyphomicrobiales bacterium]|nr:DUF861 domain-containing protein [Hyphomicrobiales bacterium]